MRTILLTCCFLGLASCSASVDDERVNVILDIDGDLEAGLTGYTNECERCHGPGGNGDGNIIGPAIQDNTYDRKDVIEFMLQGPSGMPVYSGKPDTFIADVSAYVLTL